MEVPLALNLWQRFKAATWSLAINPQQMLTVLLVIGLNGRFAIRMGSRHEKNQS